MNEARMKMELHKVLREIQMHGTEYTFFRKKVDKYGEPTKEEPEQIANVKGLFHVSKGYITHENIGEIKTEDFFVINGNKYKVVEKNNIQEYNIVTDISLELVLDGSN